MQLANFADPVGEIRRGRPGRNSADTVCRIRAARTGREILGDGFEQRVRSKACILNRGSRATQAGLLFLS